MRRSTSIGICICLLLLISTMAHAESNIVVLTASAAHPIEDLPVSSVWTGEPLATDTPICLTAASSRTPGQVEQTASGQTKIWFMANVPAGETREYNITLGETCAEALFEWVPTGEFTKDLRYSGVNVLQYVHPVYDPANITGTKKPFHMVYSPDGDRAITKGAGGLYTHHRGIFFGYNNISFAGASGVDVWHANAGAYPEHREIIAEWAGPVSGGHAVVIDWIHNGKPFITETRRVWAFKRSNGEIVIDFHSTLESLVGDVVLDGDNHHAGVQFRAAQYVADNVASSRFLRPQEWEHLDPFAEHDGEIAVPWNAFQFVIEDQPYTVGYFTNPTTNPEGIRPREMSERRYGRFGEFIPTILPGDSKLEFKYRFWISSRRDDLSREEIQSQYVNYLLFSSTPQVSATAAPWSGKAPLRVGFTVTESPASALSEFAGDSIDSFEWHFGNDYTGRGPQVSHTYETEGEFEAYVIRRNPLGKVAISDPIRIVVGNTAPEPAIIAPPVGAVYDPNRPMLLIGTGLDSEDGILSAASLAWEILVDGQVIATEHGNEWMFALPNDDVFNWHGEVTFTARLTATDSEGLSQSIERTFRYSRLQAQVADMMQGFSLQTTDDTDGEMHAVTSEEGSYIAFDPLNLDGRDVMFVRVKSDAGALIAVLTGGPDGELIQLRPVAPGAQWEIIQIPIPAEITGNSGLYVVVDTLHQGEVAINWLQLVGPGWVIGD